MRRQIAYQLLGVRIPEAEFVVIGTGHQLHVGSVLAAEEGEAGDPAEVAGEGGQALAGRAPQLQGDERDQFRTAAGKEKGGWQGLSTHADGVVSATGGDSVFQRVDAENALKEDDSAKEREESEEREEVNNPRRTKRTGEVVKTETVPRCVPLARGPYTAAASSAAAVERPGRRCPSGTCECRFRRSVGPMIRR